MYTENNPCTRLYGIHLASPNAHPDSPDLEVEKPLKNLGFSASVRKGNITILLPVESREYGPVRRENDLRLLQFFTLSTAVDIIAQVMSHLSNIFCEIITMGPLGVKYKSNFLKLFL